MLFGDRFPELADLPKDKVSEARDWVALKIAMSDVADAEWVNAAKAEEEES